MRPWICTLVLFQSGQVAQAKREVQAKGKKFIERLQCPRFHEQVGHALTGLWKDGLVFHS